MYVKNSSLKWHYHRLARRNLRLRGRAHGEFKADTSAFVRQLIAEYLSNSTEICNHLEGEFAIAIWDQTEQQLMLASDPSAAVRLYYANVPGVGFAFGNHAGALAQKWRLGGGVNEDWIAAYTCSVPTEPGSTCLRAVRSVEAGCALIVGSGNQRIQRYWRPLPMPECDNESIIKAYRARLFERVADAIRGSTATAVALSGGLDSSSLFRVANIIAPANLGLLQIEYLAILLQTSSNMRPLHWRKPTLNLPFLLTAGNSRWPRCCDSRASRTQLANLCLPVH